MSQDAFTVADVRACVRFLRRRNKPVVYGRYWWGLTLAQQRGLQAAERHGVRMETAMRRLNIVTHEVFWRRRLVHLLEVRAIQQAIVGALARAGYLR
jgi:hypothetical protein